MRLPRFRLRTLMIAAAVGFMVGDWWSTAEFPAPLVWGVLLFPPLVGACWAGFRSRQRPLGHLRRSLFAGVLQAGLMSYLMAIQWALGGTTGPAPVYSDWPEFYFNAPEWSVLSLIAATAVGLVVEAWLLLIRLGTCPRAALPLHPPAPTRCPPKGHALRGLMAAVAIMMTVNLAWTTRERIRRWERAEEHRRLAAMHEGLSENALEMAKDQERLARSTGRTSHRGEARRLRDRADLWRGSSVYHASLVRKYRRYAMFFFLPVPSDPPAPL